MNQQILIENFTEAFSTVNAASLKSNDDFIVVTIRQHLSGLTKAFIQHLSNISRGNTGFINFLQSKDDHSNRALDFEIRNLLTVLSIFFNLSKLNQLDFLRAEKSLLILQKSIVDNATLMKSQLAKRPVKIYSSNILKTDNLNPIKREIMNFINQERETVNIDVFNKFRDKSRRTIKRYLSELINLGYLDRESQGKKVYYKPSSLVLDGMREEPNS